MEFKTSRSKLLLSVALSIILILNIASALQGNNVAYGVRTFTMDNAGPSTTRFKDKNKEFNG